MPGPRQYMYDLRLHKAPHWLGAGAYYVYAVKDDRLVAVISRIGHQGYTWQLYDGSVRADYRAPVKTLNDARAAIAAALKAKEPS